MVWRERWVLWWNSEVGEERADETCQRKCFLPKCHLQMTKGQKFTPSHSHVTINGSPNSRAFTVDHMAAASLCPPLSKWELAIRTSFSGMLSATTPWLSLHDWCYQSIVKLEDYKRLKLGKARRSEESQKLHLYTLRGPEVVQTCWVRLWSLAKHLLKSFLNTHSAKTVT